MCVLEACVTDALSQRPMYGLVSPRQERMDQGTKLKSQKWLLSSYHQRTEFKTTCLESLSLNASQLMNPSARETTASTSEPSQGSNDLEAETIPWMF